MEKIQNKAVELFLKNMVYLEKNEKDLYDRVSFLTSSIENSNYKERYHLEYINEDQQFDIFDEYTNNYLYNREPSKFVKESVKNSNFDKLNSIDLLNPKIYNQTKPFLIDSNMNNVFKTRLELLNDIFDYTSVFKKSTVYNNKKFKTIDKFMFVGALLGTHIPEIIKKLRLKYVLIYENNLEIFRLSLFTTDYASISTNTQIIFSVMPDSNKLELDIHNFLNYSFKSNYMIKYYCSNYNIGDFFDRVMIVVSKISPTVYNYWHALNVHMQRSFENIMKYPVMDNTKNLSILKNIPTLILAAGPSLGKHIEWVKKHQDKFYIVAISAVVTKLIKEDIKINLIVSVDESEVIKKQFLDEYKDIIKKIPIIAASGTYNKVLDMFESKHVLLNEAMTQYKEKSVLISANSVGEISLHLTASLGPNEIYLLGSDLAFDQDSGDTHIKEHLKSKSSSLTDDQKEDNFSMKSGGFSISDSTVNVKGNFRDSVVTSIIFEKSIKAYNSALKIINEKNNCSVYNLNDGAYFDGAVPLSIDDVKIGEAIPKLSMEKFIEEMHKDLEIGFTHSELNALKNSVTLVNKLIDLLNKLDSLKIKSYDLFITARQEIFHLIIIDMVEYNKFYLSKIFRTYILTMESYIGYQFNDKEMKNEGNLIKKVKRLWCKHLLLLANVYKNTIEEVY